MANITYLKKAVEALRFQYKMDAVTHWGNISNQTNYNSILFNQEFTKAIWGVEWKNHLSKMVISEDPLKYFEENTNY